MSLPKETGLFARQESIPGLAVPQWVTVFVSKSFFAEPSGGPYFLRELMEAIATVGTVGATFVVDVDRDAEKYTLVRDILLSSTRGLAKSRPYFRHVVCTQPYYEAGNRKVVESGSLVALTSGPEVFCGGQHPKRNFVVLDVRASIIARSSRPVAMLRDLYEDPVHSSPVASMPQWNSGIRAISLRRRLEILLLLNTLCKPAALANDSFFRPVEFADRTVVQVVNDRSLKYKLQPAT